MYIYDYYIYIYQITLILRHLYNFICNHRTINTWLAPDSPCQNDANAADHGIPWAPRQAETLNIETPLINGRTAVEQNQLNRKTHRQP
jgi:hypothetical protein